MNKTVWIIVVVLVALVGGWMLMGGSNTTPTDTSIPVEPSPAPVVTSSNAVLIASFKFAPNTITVKKGTTVLWTNTDSSPHTVTGDGGLDSGTMAINQTYSFTFDSVGTFNYRCAFHPGMTGNVVVTE
ncbi:MAG: plastocyanin/azurin family copper-binding protein [bacterium]|nr:plastocyanin/azurin family copper-binding protein [bacterium]